MTRTALVVASAFLLLLAGCGGPAARPVGPTAPTTPTVTTSHTSPTAPTTLIGPSAAPSDGVPSFAHIVLVIMENHSQAQVLGGGSAPFIRTLGSSGVTLTNSVGVGEPSEPNYLALFTGSTQSLSSDACPKTFSGPNLAGELMARGLTFTGYSEGLPAVGYTGCGTGGYARKHNPWADFPALPASVNQPFSAFPESNFAALPTVSIVVPDLAHDMHDGTIAAGDSWLRANLGSYADWALHNDSLLIVTWDESGSTLATRIPTILYGARLQSGTDGSPVTHYTVLRTIEAAYGLSALGASAHVSPLSADWQR